MLPWTNVYRMKDQEEPDAEWETNHEEPRQRFAFALLLTLNHAGAGNLVDNGHPVKGC
jgi:hypothetical protein